MQSVASRSRDRLVVLPGITSRLASCGVIDSRLRRSIGRLMFDLLISAVVAVPIAWIFTVAGVVVSLAIIGWAWAARPRAAFDPEILSRYPQEILDRYCIARGHDMRPDRGVYRPVCARCGRVVR